MTSRKTTPEVELQRLANSAGRKARLQELDAASGDRPAKTDASAEENGRMLRRIGGKIVSEVNSKRQQAMQVEFREHFRYFHMTLAAKARMLLIGFVEAGVQNMPLAPFYPTPGSLLDWECRWSVAELLRLAKPPTDILRLVASQFVPDDDHALAGPRRAELKYRKRGNPPNEYRGDLIAASVAAVVAEGAMVKKAVGDVADRLNISDRQVKRLRRKSTAAKRGDKVAVSVPRPER